MQRELDESLLEIKKTAPQILSDRLAAILDAKEINPEHLNEILRDILIADLSQEQRLNIFKELGSLEFLQKFFEYYTDIEELIKQIIFFFIPFKNDDFLKTQVNSTIKYLFQNFKNKIIEFQKINLCFDLLTPEHCENKYDWESKHALSISDIFLRFVFLDSPFGLRFDNLLQGCQKKVIALCTTYSNLISLTQLLQDHEREPNIDIVRSLGFLVSHLASSTETEKFHEYLKEKVNFEDSIYDRQLNFSQSTTLATTLFIIGVINSNNTLIETFLSSTDLLKLIDWQDFCHVEWYQLSLHYKELISKNCPELSSFLSLDSRFLVKKTYSLPTYLADKKPEILLDDWKKISPKSIIDFTQYQDFIQLFNLNEQQAVTTYEVKENEYRHNQIHITYPQPDLFDILSKSHRLLLYEAKRIYISLYEIFADLLNIFLAVPGNIIFQFDGRFTDPILFEKIQTLQPQLAPNLLTAGSFQPINSKNSPKALALDPTPLTSPLNRPAV